MEEKTILAIAVMMACIGLSMLYFIYENKEVELTENIETQLGNDVKVQGIVKKISQKEYNKKK